MSSSRATIDRDEKNKLSVLDSQNDASSLQLKNPSGISARNTENPSDIAPKKDEEGDDSCCSPENEESVIKRKKQVSGAAMRKKSYQKAMRETYVINSSVVESTSGSTPPKIEEPETESSETLPKLVDTPDEGWSSPSNSSPLSLSDVTLERHSLPMSSLDCNGINISRSVSFNDRLLDPPRPASTELCEPPNTVVRGRRGSNSTPSSPLRRLLSTPAGLQEVKYSSGSSSPEDSPGNFQNKKSIRNMTSNLAQRLSFKKKTEPKELKEAKPKSSTANEPLSVEDGVDSFQSLLNLFECPGCNSLMVPPLLQCMKGHLVCQKCKVTFKGTCPICKQRVTGTTNYMMEQVCQLVRFPCQFVKFGCSEYYSPKQKTDHENFCNFRPVSCHFENRGCDCVLPLKDMNAHISACQFQFKTKSKLFSLKR